jgi:hypothetical protein
VTEPTAAHGTAGASSRREGERRNAKRKAAVRERHPRIGGIILALQDAPQHERSWAHGAGGEELVEQALTKHAPDVVILHDRRIPGSRANIDHIAIAATGVWVIDSKRYKGKLQVAKPLFGKPISDDRPPRSPRRDPRVEGRQLPPRCRGGLGVGRRQAARPTRLPF